jgi:Glycosyl hydrolase family 79 C-terminal beta domain
MRRSPRRTLLVVAVALATLGVGITAAACGASPSAGSTSGTERLTVDTAAAGRTLPNGFLGLSFEFRGLEEYLGANPAALDPVFLQLVRNLAPAQNPVLRIGGDSTDWTWWPVPHMAKPGGVAYSIGPQWAAVARAAAVALRARLILGVNFEADSRAVAATEARAMLADVGTRSIAGLELGNEPELYAAFPWYKTKAGVPVPGRARPYDFQQYVQDYSGVVSALPQAPVAGPSSGAPDYLDNLGQFLSDEPRVRLVTVHAYPLKHCEPAVHPTIAQLLATTTSQALTTQAGTLAAIAHHHGLPLRVDELNAVSCGGWPPVTNSFAAALWALNQLFELDRAGVDGVNLFTVPNTSQHLIVTSEAGGRWSGAVQHEYYGLMAFAQAAPARSHLLTVSGAQGSGTEAWATSGPGGQIHVVLINTGASTRSFALRIGGIGGPVSVQRLTAPSLAASSGATLGGQAIAPATGALAGHSTTSTVAPSGGAYTVSVPAGSAAIVASPAPQSYP